MRTRNRRRGRRVNWSYSSAGLIQLGGAIAQIPGYLWLMPPGRAQYLMDSRGRDSLTYHGSHLWLDFWWRNVGEDTGLPDVDFAVFKTTIADASSNAPDLTPMLSQWEEPPVPSSLTAWEDDTDDGNYGFLWQHHIKGMSPPNALVGTNSGGAGELYHSHNQYDIARVGSSDNPSLVCRKFCVTQEWQPDVVIRSKRRLAKGEGILLAAIATFGTATMFADCNVHFRTLST